MVRRAKFSIRLGAVAVVLVPVGGVAVSSFGDTVPQSSSAPTSSVPDTNDFSDGEILAMLVTESEVDGRVAHPLLFDDGGGSAPFRRGFRLCPEAGPVQLFDEAPQATTFVEGYLTSVRQFISVGNETAQRARFDEAAVALDQCHGTSEKFTSGTLTTNQIKHASIPVDARVYHVVFTPESGRVYRWHVVYARVGPVLTMLRFNSFETYQVLPFVHRALSRIAQVTASPGPPDTAAIGEPEVPTPEGFVEAALPASTPPRAPHGVGTQFERRSVRNHRKAEPVVPARRVGSPCAESSTA